MGGEVPPSDSETGFPDSPSWFDRDRERRGAGRGGCLAPASSPPPTRRASVSSTTWTMAAQQRWSPGVAVAGRAGGGSSPPGELRAGSAAPWTVPTTRWTRCADRTWHPSGLLASGGLSPAIRGSPGVPGSGPAGCARRAAPARARRGQRDLRGRRGADQRGQARAGPGRQHPRRGGRRPLRVAVTDDGVGAAAFGGGTGLSGRGPRRGARRPVRSDSPDGGGNEPARGLPVTSSPPELHPARHRPGVKHPVPG